MLTAPEWLTARVTIGLVPKDDWGEGAWQREPDLVHWIFRGVPCLILRHPYFGNLAGYIGVPRWSSCYRVMWHKIDHLFPSAHGGLTYGGACLVRLPRAREYWWIGFDCGHAFDVAPAILARCPELRDLPPIEFGDGFKFGSEYRPIGYVRRRVEGMVDSLLLLPRRRYRQRIEARRFARDVRAARRELVRLAGARERNAAAYASVIRSRIWHSFGVVVSLPRSLRRAHAFSI